MTEYYCYKLMLLNQKIVSLKYREKNGTFTATSIFKKPVTCSKLPKLYILKHKTQIIYIGVTSQNITNRFRYGLKAKGKHGYYGYRWKDLKEELTVLIWCFPGESISRIESIEAEIVFAVRHNTSQWPEYQIEIHFRNVTDEEKKMAQLIYDQAKNI